MQEMENSFIPTLNEFSELLKQVTAMHAQHVVQTGNAIKQIKDETNSIETQQLQQFDETGTPPKVDIVQQIELFKTHSKELREIFQTHIDETNFMLGKFANHWGGYIEQMGVEYMLNLLRKNYEVHTWYQKFKRYWGKSRNVEIDLVAINPTTAYIIEVKNQLKPEVIKQILIILDKIKEHCPELHAYKIQPILMCLHVDEQLLHTLNCGGIWIYKYEGLLGPKHRNSWQLCQYTPMPTDANVEDSEEE